MQSLRKIVESPRAEKFWQIALAFFATYYFLFQLLSNLPTGPFSKVIVPKPARQVMNNLGQYQKGWGMFAIVASSTSELNLVYYFKESPVERVSLVKVRPGYLLNAWNEVSQDLQYDDNAAGDYYRMQLLRRECQKNTSRGVLRVQLEQHTIGIKNPYNPYPASIPADSSNVLADVTCTL